MNAPQLAALVFAVAALLVTAAMAVYFLDRIGSENTTVFVAAVSLFTLIVRELAGIVTAAARGAFADNPKEKE